MELVDFLRARLNEDEAVALEAPPGPWLIGNAVDPTKPCSVHTFPGVRLVADGLNWLVAEHIAHQNPARILAEVETKRRLLELHAPQPEPFSPTQKACKLCGNDARPEWRANWPCLSLRLLARPFRTHRDFDPAWLED